MPAAITPPAISSKDLSVPKTTMNGTLGTKRKIICFSGTWVLILLITTFLVKAV